MALDMSGWPLEAKVSYLSALAWAGETEEFSKFLEPLEALWDDAYYSAPAFALLVDVFSSISQRDEASAHKAAGMCKELLAHGQKAARVPGLAHDMKENRAKSEILCALKLGWLAQNAMHGARKMGWQGGEKLARECVGGMVAGVCKAFADHSDVDLDAQLGSNTHQIQTALETASCGQADKGLLEFCAMPPVAKRIGSMLASGRRESRHGDSAEALDKIRAQKAVFKAVLGALEKCGDGESAEEYKLAALWTSFMGDWRAGRDERADLARMALASCIGAGATEERLKRAWASIGSGFSRSLVDVDFLEELMETMDKSGFEPQSVRALPSMEFAKERSVDWLGGDSEAKAAALLRVRAKEKALGWNGREDEDAADAEILEKLCETLHPVCRHEWLKKAGASPMELKKAATAGCGAAKEELPRLLRRGMCDLPSADLARLVASYARCGADLRGVRELARRVGEWDKEAMEEALALAEKFGIDRDLEKAGKRRKAPVPQSGAKPKGI